MFVGPFVELVQEMGKLLVGSVWVRGEGEGSGERGEGRGEGRGERREEKRGERKEGRRELSPDNNKTFRGCFKLTQNGTHGPRGQHFKGACRLAVKELNNEISTRSTEFRDFSKNCRANKLCNFPEKFGKFRRIPKNSQKFPAF
jgi:hypothetical protein